MSTVVTNGVRCRECLPEVVAGTCSGKALTLTIGSVTKSIEGGSWVVL